MNTSLYDIPVKKIDGTSATLKEHEGEVLLVVNVASKCGLTPQYEGLEALHQHFADRKFSVLGFPANDFAAKSRATTPRSASSAPRNSVWNFKTKQSRHWSLMRTLYCPERLPLRASSRFPGEPA